MPQTFAHVSATSLQEPPSRLGIGNDAALSSTSIAILSYIESISDAVAFFDRLIAEGIQSDSSSTAEAFHKEYASHKGILTSIGASHSTALKAAQPEIIMKARMYALALGGAELRGAMDVNLTLSPLNQCNDRSNQENEDFYPGVPEKLLELCQSSRTLLISGDQLEKLEKSFLKSFQKILQDVELTPEARENIRRNLVLYSETGARKTTLADGMGNFNPAERQPFAELTKDQYDGISKIVIPEIKVSCCNDKGLRIFHNDIAAEDILDPLSTDKTRPLYVQTPADSSHRSIEVSIFGIQEGKRKEELRTLLNGENEEAKELRALRSKIIGTANDLLKKHGLAVRAELGGTSTLDFRVANKGDVVVKDSTNDPSFDASRVVYIGIGDNAHFAATISLLPSCVLF